MWSGRVMFDALHRVCSEYNRTVLRIICKVYQVAETHTPVIKRVAQAYTMYTINSTTHVLSLHPVFRNTQALIYINVQWWIYLLFNMVIFDWGIYVSKVTL